MLSKHKKRKREVKKYGSHGSHASSLLSSSHARDLSLSESIVGTLMSYNHLSNKCPFVLLLLSSVGVHARVPEREREGDKKEEEEEK